jgi:hypothetical protein
MANYDHFSAKNWVTLLPSPGSDQSVVDQPLAGRNPPATGVMIDFSARVESSAARSWLR